ncbi:hypothetical protein LOTGIDRAFT_174101 [Lottia gigantea]|uniref:PKD domain-containing protein n=1 Tax=Lottia gigantea TaxID=225164 RepID=V4A3Z2_LOTGI|nr:hypothetical protein LOTGIDRAFT_174101 [Lottia gigantea]ESO98628.1 hypothetical protein LOTGIDRAFT_174101 [Lottia gigantea]
MKKIQCFVMVYIVYCFILYVESSLGCTEPQPVLHAYRYTDDTSLPEGALVNYTCYQNHYWISGDLKRECQGGVLTGESPVCDEYAVLTPAHAILPEPSSLGGMDNYLTDGDVLTCESTTPSTDPRWTIEFDGAKYVFSVELTVEWQSNVDINKIEVHVRNTTQNPTTLCGTINFPFTSSGNVDFMCPPNLIGSHLVIQGFGTGVYGLGLCDVKAKGKDWYYECGDPSFVYGAEVSSKKTVGGNMIVQYSCVEGFYYGGKNPESTCRNGQWSVVDILCLRSAATISNAEPITNFEISPGGTNLIKLTDEDQIVNVQYATGTGSTLTATLNSDPIPSSDITHSETSKTGAVTIKTSHPVFTSYGIYDLTLELLNNEGKKHLNLYIFHEAKVAGLPPPGRKHFCNINETYVIEFDLVSGSNVLSEWMFEQYSILQIYSGDINRLWKNYSCDAILKDNVTVVAANNASAEYTWFLLTVQYPVNHIVASVDSPVAETSSNLKFDIQTQSEALTPMGTLQAQIFYHTGENETKSFTPGESTEFFKSFTTQGQFKANLSIWSESSSDNLEVDFAIWDKLEDLTLEPKKPYAEVGKVVTFEFINPPPSGFEYKIIYGNSKQASNTEDDLYLPFSQAPLNTTYSEPITYYISMRSFNPEYEKNYTTSIIIQNAVGNLTLTPSSLVIPYDNSTVEFTLSMEHEMPPPTSVSCVFTYGDGNDENVTLDLTWTSPFSHLYTYSNIGNYSVNVFCSNQISNITLFSSIGVRYYTIDDVNLFHQNPFPTNFTEGRDVEFSLRIKDLDVTPPNTQLTWNFGDDSTPLVQTFNEWILVHHFPKRDIFMGMLEINMSNETKTITFTQQIGTVTISSDILIVLAGNPVLFTTQIINTGSVEPLSYQIDFGDGTVPVSSQNFSHSFADGGYYIATAKVFNSTFSEFNTVEDVLVVENPLTSLLSVSAQNVAFPPGNFRLSLGLPPGSKPITFVTCEYNFGDTVDNVLHYHTDNISLSHPITFLHTYTKLGPYTILYNCSNVLTSTSGKLSTSVINECFSIIGIFDPQYSYQDNPMRIYTSQLMQISSRLTIYCGEHQPRFVWTLKNITDGNMTNVSLDQPQTDFIRFPKNSIPKGKYILSLNVSFVLKPESWLNEITFLEFRDPPIRAEIVGGFQRTTGMKDITIDAVPLSYDPLKEQGQPDDLSYSWTCKKVNTTTVLELLSKYKNESFSIPCNSVSYQLAAGTLLFKASSEERPIGYIFTLEVNKPGRTAGEFIQTVQVLYEAPDINIL